jgi:hypothetical protein
MRLRGFLRVRVLNGFSLFKVSMLAYRTQLLWRAQALPED